METSAIEPLAIAEWESLAMKEWSLWLSKNGVFGYRGWESLAMEVFGSCRMGVFGYGGMGWSRFARSGTRSQSGTCRFEPT